MLAKSKVYEDLVAKNLRQNDDELGSNLIDFDKKTTVFEAEVVDNSSAEVKSGTLKRNDGSENEWNWSRGGSDKLIQTNRESAKSFSSSARVKTQWDKVLGSSAKQHLAEIHLATLEEREAVQSTSAAATTSTRRDADREQRLQLLKLKQSTHNSKEA